MSHLFPTGENKSWINHQNEKPLSIWMKRTWKPSKVSRRNTTSQLIGLSISVFRDTSQRWLSGFKKMNPEQRCWGIVLKGIQKYELTVMIEKNLSTNERKLKREIEKLLSQSAQLREVRLVQVIKSLRWTHEDPCDPITINSDEVFTRGDTWDESQRTLLSTQTSEMD